MGNSQKDGHPSKDGVRASIRNFYSDHSWIEGSSVEQLHRLSGVDGVSEICAFPDLHPGKYGPVGVAIRSTNIHPNLIGNDIGCGMALFLLSGSERKFKIEKAFGQLRSLAEDPIDNGIDALASVGLPETLAPSALGSIGGGNHFCEVLGIEEIFEETGPFKKGDLFLLIHTGSRSLGEAVFSSFTSEQQSGMHPDSLEAAAYMSSHIQCVTWASLNRRLIAERAADALGMDFKLITDVPHNEIVKDGNSFIHRKGAARALPGDLVPIAGSRASLSYLVEASSGVQQSLFSLSHGSGRKYDRVSMRHRVGKTKSEREALMRNQWGGLAICDNKNLLQEEAGIAYKSAKTVVADLSQFGLVKPRLSLKPLLTYKVADLELNKETKTLREHRQNKGGRHYD